VDGPSWPLVFAAGSPAPLSLPSSTAPALLVNDPIFPSGRESRSPNPPNPAPSHSPHALPPPGKLPVFPSEARPQARGFVVVTASSARRSPWPVQEPVCARCNQVPSYAQVLGLQGSQPATDSNTPTSWRIETRPAGFEHRARVQIEDSVADWGASSLREPSDVAHPAAVMVRRHTQERQLTRPLSSQPRP